MKLNKKKDSSCDSCGKRKCLLAEFSINYLEDFDNEYRKIPITICKDCAEKAVKIISKGESDGK